MHPHSPHHTLLCSCTTSLGGKGTAQRAGRPGLPESQRRFRLVTPNAQSQREPAMITPRRGNSRAQGRQGSRQTDARCTRRLRDRGRALELGVNEHLQPTPCYQAHLFTQDSPPGGCSLPAQGGRRDPGLSAHPQGVRVSALCPPLTGWGSQGAFSLDNGTSTF